MTRLRDKIEEVLCVSGKLRAKGREGEADEASAQIPVMQHELGELELELDSFLREGKLRVVLMSATLDPTLFASYFGGAPVPLAAC